MIFFFFWKKISLVAGVDWFCVGQEWKQDEHALVPGIQMLWWFRLCSAIPRAWPEMTNRMVGYVQILASRNGGGAGQETDLPSPFKDSFSDVLHITLQRSEWQ